MIALLAAIAAVVIPAPVHGDFDHDGKPDVAELIATHGGNYDLIIRRGAVGHPTSIIARFTAKDLDYLFITKARPGRWRTWCGKGGGNDDDPCPRKWVRLRGDTLDFGMKESTESVAIWSGRRFEIVLLSD